MNKSKTIDKSKQKIDYFAPSKETDKIIGFGTKETKKLFGHSFGWKHDNIRVNDVY